MHDGVSVKGNLTIVLKDKNGNIKTEMKNHNMILTDGNEIFADLAGGTGGQGPIIVMAVGDSNAAVNPAQTDLQGAEISRELTTNLRVGTVIRYAVTFTNGGGIPWAVEEAILADTNAVIGARKCASRSLISIAVGLGDILTILWEIQFA